MKRISKAKAIEIILKEKRKGTTYTDCLGVIRSNSDLAESSFAKYWKEAEQIHLERKKAIEAELMRVDIEHKKEELKKNLLTFDEKREIAATIARGESYESGGQIVIPSSSERIKALEYDSKLMADIASTKIDASITTYNIPKLPDIIDRKK